MTETNKLPESTLVKTQPKKIHSYHNADGSQIRIRMQYDDDCGNGHNSFSITGDWWETKPTNSRKEPDCCGCIHDLIEKYAPDLAKYIKWHLCSSDGPIHYLGNAVYSAGNQDCWKRAPGDVSQSEYGIRFNGSTVTHFINSKLYTYLKTAIENEVHEFKVITVTHKKKPNTFTPNYSVNDFTDIWHECPFKTITEAEEMCKALMNETVEFVNLPVAYSKGKAREFDSARYHAIWPEATDEQLSLPKEELEKILEARLPVLMQEFKAAMEELGFVY